MAEFIYGNDGTNYRVLDHTKDISTELCGAIAREVCIGFLSDYRGRLDRSDRQPASVAVMITDLKGLFPENKLILCRQARMTWAASPSFFAHIWVLEEKEDSAEKFFKQLPWMELDKAFQQDIGNKDGFHFTYRLFFYPRQAKLGAGDNFNKRSILEILLQGCMRSNKYQMRLVLDRTGDEYNERSREIISELYRMLPEGLRKLLGFCTFALPDCSMPREIKLILIDPVLMEGREYFRSEEFVSLEAPRPGVPIWPEVADYVDGLLSGYGTQSRMTRQCSVRDAIAEYNLNVRWRKRRIKEISEELAFFAKRSGENRRSSEWLQFRKIVLDRKEEIRASVDWSDVLEKNSITCEKFRAWYDEFGALSCLYDVIPELEFPGEKVRCAARNMILLLDRQQNCRAAAACADELLQLFEMTAGECLKNSLVELEIFVKWFYECNHLAISLENLEPAAGYLRETSTELGFPNNEFAEMGDEEHKKGNFRGKAAERLAQIVRQTLNGIKIIHYREQKDERENRN